MKTLLFRNTAWFLVLTFCFTQVAPAGLADTNLNEISKDTGVSAVVDPLEVGAKKLAEESRLIKTPAKDSIAFLLGDQGISPALSKSSGKEGATMTTEMTTMVTSDQKDTGKRNSGVLTPEESKEVVQILHVKPSSKETSEDGMCTRSIPPSCRYTTTTQYFDRKGNLIGSKEVRINAPANGERTTTVTWRDAEGKILQERRSSAEVRAIQQAVKVGLANTFGFTQAALDQLIKDGKIVIKVDLKRLTATVTIDRSVTLPSGTVNMLNPLGLTTLPGQIQFQLKKYDGKKNLEEDGSVVWELPDTYYVISGGFQIKNTSSALTYNPVRNPMLDQLNWVGDGQLASLKIYNEEPGYVCKKAPCHELLETVMFDYLARKGETRVTLTITYAKPRDGVASREVVLTASSIKISGDDQYYIQTVTDKDRAGNVIVTSKFNYRPGPTIYCVKAPCPQSPLRLVSISRTNAAGRLSDIAINGNNAVITLAGGKVQEVKFKTIEGLLAQARQFEMANAIPKAVQDYVDALNRQLLRTGFSATPVLQKDGTYLIRVSRVNSCSVPEGLNCQSTSGAPGTFSMMEFNLDADGKLDVKSIKVWFVASGEMNGGTLFDAARQIFANRMREDAEKDMYITPPPNPGMHFLTMIMQFANFKPQQGGGFKFTYDDQVYRASLDADGNVILCRGKVLQDGTVQYFDSLGRMMEEERKDGSAVLYSYEGNESMPSSVTFVRPDGKRVCVTLERNEKGPVRVDILALEQVVIDLLARGEDASELVLDNYKTESGKCTQDIPRSSCSESLGFDLISSSMVYHYDISHSWSERNKTNTYRITQFSKTPMAVWNYVKALKETLGEDKFSVTLVFRRDGTYLVKVGRVNSCPPGATCEQMLLIGGFSSLEFRLTPEGVIRDSFKAVYIEKEVNGLLLLNAMSALEASFHPQGSEWLPPPANYIAWLVRLMTETVVNDSRANYLGFDHEKNTYLWSLDEHGNMKLTKELTPEQKAIAAVKADLTKSMGLTAAQLEALIESVTFEPSPTTDAAFLVRVKFKEGSMGAGRLIDVLGSGRTPNFARYSLNSNLELQSSVFLIDLPALRPNQTRYVWGNVAYDNLGRIASIDLEEHVSGRDSYGMPVLGFRKSYRDVYTYGDGTVTIRRSPEGHVITVDGDHPMPPKQVILLRRMEDGQYHIQTLTDNDPTGKPIATSRFQYWVMISQVLCVEGSLCTPPPAQVGIDRITRIDADGNALSEIVFNGDKALITLANGASKEVSPTTMQALLDLARQFETENVIPSAVQKYMARLGEIFPGYQVKAEFVPGSYCPQGEACLLPDVPAHWAITVLNPVRHQNPGHLRELVIHVFRGSVRSDLTDLNGGWDSADTEQRLISAQFDGIVNVNAQLLYGALEKLYPLPLLDPCVGEGCVSKMIVNWPVWEALSRITVTEAEAGVTHFSLDGNDYKVMPDGVLYKEVAVSPVILARAKEILGAVRGFILQEVLSSSIVGTVEGGAIVSYFYNDAGDFVGTYTTNPSLGPQDKPTWHDAEGKVVLVEGPVLRPFTVLAFTSPTGSQDLTINVAEDGGATVEWYSKTGSGIFNPETLLLSVDFGSEAGTFQFDRTEVGGVVVYSLKSLQMVTNGSSGQNYINRTFLPNGRVKSVESNSLFAGVTMRQKDFYSYNDLGELAVWIKLSDSATYRTVSYQIFERENKRKILGGTDSLNDDSLFQAIHSVEQLAEVKRLMDSENTEYYSDATLQSNFYLYSIDSVRDGAGAFTVPRRVTKPGIIYIVHGQADVLSDENDDERFNDLQEVHGYTVTFGLGSAQEGDPLTYGLSFLRKVTAPAGTSSTLASTRAQSEGSSVVVNGEMYEVVAFVNYPDRKEVEFAGKKYQIKSDGQGGIQLEEGSVTPEQVAFAKNFLGQGVSYGIVGVTGTGTPVIRFYDASGNLLGRSEDTRSTVGADGKESWFKGEALLSEIFQDGSEKMYAKDGQGNSVVLFLQPNGTWVRFVYSNFQDSASSVDETSESGNFSSGVLGVLVNMINSPVVSAVWIRHFVARGLNQDFGDAQRATLRQLIGTGLASRLEGSSRDNSGEWDEAAAALSELAVFLLDQDPWGPASSYFRVLAEKAKAYPEAPLAGTFRVFLRNLLRPAVLTSTTGKVLIAESEEDFQIRVEKTMRFWDEQRIALIDPANLLSIDPGLIDALINTFSMYPPEVIRGRFHVFYIAPPVDPTRVDGNAEFNGGQGFLAFSYLSRVLEDETIFNDRKLGGGRSSLIKLIVHHVGHYVHSLYPYGQDPVLKNIFDPLSNGSSDPLDFYGQYASLNQEEDFAQSATYFTELSNAAQERYGNELFAMGLDRLEMGRPIFLEKLLIFLSRVFVGSVEGRTVLYYPRVERISMPGDEYDTKSFTKELIPALLNSMGLITEITFGYASFNFVYNEQGRIMTMTLSTAQGGAQGLLSLKTNFQNAADLARFQAAGADLGLNRVTTRYSADGSNTEWLWASASDPNKTYQMKRVVVNGLEHWSFSAVLAVVPSGVLQAAQANLSQKELAQFEAALADTGASGAFLYKETGSERTWSWTSIADPDKIYTLRLSQETSGGAEVWDFVSMSVVTGDEVRSRLGLIANLDMRVASGTAIEDGAQFIRIDLNEYESVYQWGSASDPVVSYRLVVNTHVPSGSTFKSEANFYREEMTGVEALEAFAWNLRAGRAQFEAALADAVTGARFSVVRTSDAGEVWSWVSASDPKKTYRVSRSVVREANADATFRDIENWTFATLITITRTEAEQFASQLPADSREKILKALAGTDAATAFTMTVNAGDEVRAQLELIADFGVRAHVAAAIARGELFSRISFGDYASPYLWNDLNPQWANFYCLAVDTHVSTGILPPISRSEVTLSVMENQQRAYVLDYVDLLEPEQKVLLAAAAADLGGLVKYAWQLDSTGVQRYSWAWKSVDGQTLYGFAVGSVKSLNTDGTYSYPEAVFSASKAVTKDEVEQWGSQLPAGTDAAAQLSQALADTNSSTVFTKTVSGDVEAWSWRSASDPKKTFLLSCETLNETQHWSFIALPAVFPSAIHQMAQTKLSEAELVQFEAALADAGANAEFVYKETGPARSWTWTSVSNPDRTYVLRRDVAHQAEQWIFEVRIVVSMDEILNLPGLFHGGRDSVENAIADGARFIKNTIGDYESSYQWISSSRKDSISYRIAINTRVPSATEPGIYVTEVNFSYIEMLSGVKGGVNGYANTLADLADRERFITAIRDDISGWAAYVYQINQEGDSSYSVSWLSLDLSKRYLLKWDGRWVGEFSSEPVLS